MKAPSFQFYPNDFLVSTAAMSAEAVGAYIRLLCYQWSNGSIPNDKEKAVRLASCSADGLAEVWHKFGIDDDGNLRNARMESIRAERQAFIDGQAQKAKKGWESRKTRGSALPDERLAIGKPEASQCQNDGLQSSSSSSNNINTSPIEPLRLQVCSWFGRRSSTPWSEKEIKILKVMNSTATPEEIGLLESFYKFDHPTQWDSRRRDIQTFLNNWQSEIDKARAWKRKRDNPQPSHDNGNPPRKSWTEMTKEEIMREVL